MVRGRYAYVALAVLALLLFGASILFTVTWVQHVNREFCQVVSGVTATPVSRPADPAANPSRVQAWELYERFVVLGQHLGC